MKVQPNFWEQEEKTAGIPVDDDKVVTIGKDGKIKVDDVKDPINEEDRKKRFNLDEEKPAGIPVDDDKVVTIGPDGKIKVDDVKDPINEEDRKKRFNLAMQQKRQNGGH